MKKLIVIFVLCSSLSWAQKTVTEKASTGATPTFDMHGNAVLMNNLVVRGISQTNKDPALVGSFWFNFGSQLSLGLTGSNVHYASELNTHLNLQANAELKIDFSQNTHFLLKYDMDQFYSDSTRNGSIVGLNFIAFETYLVSYTMISNWEGTSTSATNYSFGYIKKIFGTWKWTTVGGYNMVSARNHSNYFDLKSEVAQKWNAFLLGAGISGTQDSSQFNGDGDFGIIFYIGAEF